MVEGLIHNRESVRMTAEIRGTLSDTLDFGEGGFGRLSSFETGDWRASALQSGRTEMSERDVTG